MHPMAQTYAQIQKQIAKLTLEAEKLRRQEVAGAVAQIKEIMETYGLTLSDLGPTKRKTRAKAASSVAKPGSKPARKNGKKAAHPSNKVLYRDEAGNTWGGRGPRPKWLRDALASGKQLQDYAA
jgi:DNA-binding protein H-NS